MSKGPFTKSCYTHSCHAKENSWNWVQVLLGRTLNKLHIIKRCSSNPRNPKDDDTTVPITIMMVFETWDIFSHFTNKALLFSLSVSGWTIKLWWINCYLMLKLWHFNKTVTVLLIVYGMAECLPLVRYNSRKLMDGDNFEIVKVSSKSENDVKI